MSATSATRIGTRRRRSHRTADGSTMSGLSFAAACSWLGDASAAATTSSTSFSVDDSRLARQSGSRLNVVCDVGQ
jgi:hypothetical protein